MPSTRALEPWRLFATQHLIEVLGRPEIRGPQENRTQGAVATRDGIRTEPEPNEPN